MTDLRIIPADPREAVRDVYRRFASEDRPGDPWAMPFDPRPKRNVWAPVVWSLIAAAIVSLWFI